MLMVTSSEGRSPRKALSLRENDREGMLAVFCKVSRTIMREDRSTVSEKDSLRVPASISRKNDSTSGAAKSGLKLFTRSPLSCPTGITGLPNTSRAAPDVRERYVLLEDVARSMFFLISFRSLRVSSTSTAEVLRSVLRRIPPVSLYK